MRVEIYFQQIRDLIETCLIIESSDVTYDKRATHEGFIKGTLYFVDGSMLAVREFIDVEITIDRLMYVYHYMDTSQNLIFRYDDTGHHQELNLPTFPHHKHDGKNNTVVTSSAPHLTAVLNEIEQLVQLP